MVPTKSYKSTDPAERMSHDKSNKEPLQLKFCTINPYICMQFIRRFPTYYFIWFSETPCEISMWGKGNCTMEKLSGEWGLRQLCHRSPNLKWFLALAGRKKSSIWSHCLFWDLLTAIAKGPWLSLWGRALGTIGTWCGSQTAKLRTVCSIPCPFSPSSHCSPYDSWPRLLLFY